VIEQARHVATTRATVLIEGEPGTGKGLVARAIHEDGPRRDAPFVRVGLGSLAAEGVEGELFGSEGEADPAPRGRFESAGGGTLYLDEIGEAPPAVQVKLLRAIRSACSSVPAEPRCSSPTCGSSPGPSATCRRTSRRAASARSSTSGSAACGCGCRRCASGPRDIPLLVESFLRDFNREHARRVTGITRGALDRLAAYAWPGNVR
jgi:DNA-binding NtrC family response regulator